MKKLIFSLIFLLLMPLTAFAEVYLVTLKEEPVMPLSVDTDIERVPLSSMIMYEADTMEEIYNVIDSENIISIMPDCTFELFDTPNDTYYANQWNLASINSISAYDKNLRGKGVKIGIIDSGLNTSHEDLSSAKITKRYNVFDFSDDVTDEQGHGTFVTGTIAADINNSLGIAGIADEAELYIYKIFEGKTTTTKRLLLGLEHAINDNCDVINMSLGASESNNIDEQTISTLQSMIDMAAEKNIIIVAAVGNNGSEILNYPAACEGVIGVASVGQTLTRSSFSNYNSSVFVTAPGERITGLGYSTYNSYSIPNSVNRYNCGTSYSAPVVTAMAALAKQIKSDITADEVMDVLKSTSTDLGEIGYDTYYGWGLVDIGKFTDKVMFEYVTNISLNSDNTILSYNAIKEETQMYIASYDEDKLINVDTHTLKDYGEIPISYPEGCDSVRLYFWQDMKPVWDIIEIEKTDAEE